MTAKRYDKGKERFDLFPVRPLFDIARVYNFGSQKYDDNNWRKGMKWGKVYASAMRHMHKFWNGEWLDEESGLPHLAHTAWNMITLLEYYHTFPRLDDRPRRQAKYK